MTWVKVCGITRREDAEVAVDAGADAVGFVLYPGSPRSVTPSTARKLGERLPAIRVVVTVDLDPLDLLETARLAGADGVQPHGQYAAAAARAAVGNGFLVLRPIPVDGPFRLDDLPTTEIPLLDTRRPGVHGGTGETFDWTLAAGITRPFVLAGGLRPDNVASAIDRVHPWGVDASSGLESAPGVKDHGLIEAFLAETRE